MDEYATKAITTFEDLCDLGKNVEDRHAAPIFDSASKSFSQIATDTFTGDGSTTTFDMSNVAPDGGGNEIQVFVDNVRQQEGSSLAYH